MLKQKLQKQYVVRRQEDIAAYVGRNQKLIVLDKPLDKVPAGYTQVTMSYKNEKHTFFVPQKAKYFMANSGENGKPLEALDELADFYEECGDFEHELMIGGLFNTPQVNVSTLARNSYQTWAINQLVKQGKGETPIWNEAELKRLGVNNSYIDTRLKGIAAAMLGKNAQELKSKGLEEILDHKTLIVRNKKVWERMSEQEFSQVTCWAGSHYELKPECRNGDYDIEPRHDKDHKVGLKKVRQIEAVDYTALPQIDKMEREIEEYRKNKGNEITRHDTALLRTYLNLKYIAKEDPTRQLDVVSKAK